MKYQKLACLLLATTMVWGMSGCSSDAENENGTTQDETTTGSETGGDTASYANFNFSDSLDKNGYFEGITALDYVTLPDYSQLAFDADTTTVTEEELQEGVDEFMAGYVVEAQVLDGVVEDGDVVNINYVGTVDGVEFTGGSATGYDLTIGSGTFIDDFEEQLIGHKPDDVVEVQVTFPEGHGDSTDAEGNVIPLSGQDAVFEVTINYISETSPAELNDTFIQETLLPNYGIDSEEAFYDYIEAKLLDTKKRTFAENYLMENSTYADELPATATDYTNNFTLNYAYTTALNYGYTDLEEFLILNGFESIDDYTEQQASSILYGAQFYLTLQAVAEQEDIEVTQDDVADYFTQAYNTDYADYESEYGYNYLALVTMQNAVIEKIVSICDANTLAN